jgi:hypothetical protein
MMTSPLNKRRCDQLIKRYNQRARLALDQEMTGRGMRREIIVIAGLVLAITSFIPTLLRRGCPASPTSLRSLRKADCYGRHDDFASWLAFESDFQGDE